MGCDAPLNVLLVDNRPANLLALKTVLEDLNAQLFLASSGFEALREVLNTDFAVILLDVQMPEMDGFETARRIRERDRSRKTPIIFLTAEPHTDEKVFQGYSVGAVDFLIKPVMPQILRAKVRVFLDLADTCAKLQSEITERQRAEATVTRLNADLAARAALLESANQELEAFSYSVSHDLRSPLRHIGGFVDLLRKHLQEVLDPTSTRYLGVIGDSAQHMGRLIDELLTFSRMGRLELRKSEICLEQLLREALDRLGSEVAGREIVWKHFPLPPVEGDPTLLRQVFINLLSNAIKYTRHRRPAQIEIGCQGDNAREVTLFVRDNGTGFDMKYSHKLFGVFQRLHRHDEFEGTGIGLANVRRIVHRHGGRTWAEAKLNQGATFYFSLPRKMNASAGLGGRREAEPASPALVTSGTN
jgi:two-component system sensor histidine kinase/response regulator